MAAWVAPPWDGPLSVPMALVTAEYKSASVPVVTRAEKVEALKPWSASKMRYLSIAWTVSGLGSSPVSI